ncbi:hypothetical protein ACFL3G_07635 [Planctomycetota bacterium]
MSNRVDFFQSEQTQLSFPGGTVSILLEGVLCPQLELKEIVWDGWPEFGLARFVYNRAGYPDAEKVFVEDIETVVSMGKSVSVERVYNGSAPGASGVSLTLFIGQIEGFETRVAGSAELVEIIARDFSAQCGRTTLYGRRVVDLDGSNLLLEGVGTIFNEDGKANASAEMIVNNGNSYRAFCFDPSQAKYWGLADVITYLLCEYLPSGQLQIPDIERLKAITGNQTVRDLDVTGTSLLRGLRRCCESSGLEFKFVPCVEPDSPEQQIVFYKSGVGRKVELNYQLYGEEFSISKTNISKLHSKKNFFPVTHKYIGQGDFKVYEATFDLVKAWDPADESDNYDDFSPSTNQDFHQVKDVYRKWCLNEAGDYSGSPYNQGAAFDFSEIFQGGNFAHLHRRFWPTLTTDKQNKSLGYFLQVSFDNGQSWSQYLYAFNNLLDECGVWLSSDELDIKTWAAAIKDILKFRITVSVISDERLSSVIADGPINSTVPLIEHIIILSREFKYRKVSSQSIFYRSSDEGLGVADEVDDSMELCDFVRNKARLTWKAVETFDVQTPCLAFDYQVGDRVTCSPGSRDMLKCRIDNRSISWIKRVQMDFDEQCTNLKIVRQRNLLV